MAEARHVNLQCYGHNQFHVRVGSSAWPEMQPEQRALLVVARQEGWDDARNIQTCFSPCGLQDQVLSKHLLRLTCVVRKCSSPEMPLNGSLWMALANAQRDGSPLCKQSSGPVTLYTYTCTTPTQLLYALYGITDFSSILLTSFFTLGLCFIAGLILEFMIGQMDQNFKSPSHRKMV